jgi:hypothetical protein
MVYAKGSVINGKVVLTEQQTIDTSTLTAGCFMIQIHGAEACTTCENLDKPRKCGGMSIREKYGVPLPKKQKNYSNIVCGPYKDHPNGDCYKCPRQKCTLRVEDYKEAL